MSANELVLNCRTLSDVTASQLLWRRRQVHPQRRCLAGLPEVEAERFHAELLDGVGSSEGTSAPTAQTPGFASKNMCDTRAYGYEVIYDHPLRPDDVAKVSVFTCGREVPT